MNGAAEIEGFQLPEDLGRISEEEFHELNVRLAATLNSLRRQREDLLGGPITPEFERLSTRIRELESVDEILREEHRRRQLGRFGNL